MDRLDKLRGCRHIGPVIRMVAMAPETHFDPRLSAIALHIVQRIADAAIEDMRARYDLGRILHTLRRSERGGVGAGPLRRLAERLGLDPSVLRRYAQVSETIPPREFAALLRLTNWRGEPLTWSHIELLARVRNPERRKALATAVAEGNLSVRALAARLRAER
jgi:hypothetical protein